MNRAYSILDIKQIDDGARTIEGIASTPTTDRMGDIVDPMGAVFKLPMPLLLDHDSRQSVGHVTFAKPNKSGIPFKATIQSTDEPGEVKELLDKAWQLVKLKLRAAVSIGFSINAYEILKEGGWRINEWEWLELSLVTIPANAEATITSVKSIDAALLAASGRTQEGKERTVSAGVTAKTSTPVVKVKETQTMSKKSIADQIRDMESTRAAKTAELQALQEKASGEGRTKDAAEREQFNTLKDEIKSLDDELADLRELEKMDVKAATPAAGTTVDDASRSRANESRDIGRVQVRGGNVPKGIGFVRLLAAKTNAYLSKGAFTPLQFAQGHKHWQSETPEVEQILKAAVSAGTTTDSAWGGPLVQYQNLASEFVEHLRPLTLIGRIPGLRKVPFVIKFPRQTGAAVSNWVGQSKPKPATSLAFDSLTLDPLKVAGIVPMSMELMRFSSPSAEMIVRDDLAGSIAQLVDHDFIDPEKAAVANVSPASITNGVTGVAATGTAYSNLKADVKSIMDNYFAANIVPDTVIMHQRTALSLSLMETSLGNPQFPGLTMNGGLFLGMTAYATTNVDYTEDSPQEGDLIVFLRANDIALADDGGVEVDVSTEASIEMSTTPTDPVTASTVLVSLWQQNLVGIRAERMVNWVKRRSAAVQYIKAAKYA